MSKYSNSNLRLEKEEEKEGDKNEQGKLRGERINDVLQMYIALKKERLLIYESSSFTIPSKPTESNFESVSIPNHVRRNKLFFVLR